ncbi:hypothetical protein [Anaeropeptidivorans aminofermentans]|jgi:hypothetical protein|uniref:hypothetical protein n=1 Tax=Anaeropeptidivorans aminofermentans TaxID=2934315 RepID=UPI00202407E7|nr:hypothetical protein [Anaeropeptidivorans aminofermentans]MBE6011859.1 hypothetical protein [Lachnospiraceae bacterium]
MSEIIDIIRPFAMFCAVLLIIHSILKFRGRKYGKSFEDFFEEERRANSVRKKEIPENIFYLPENSFLQELMNEPSLNERILKALNDSYKKSQRKMLQFDQPLTNNEIKYAYGTANLEKIISYEQNYENYLRALNVLARELKESGNLDAAEKVLLNVLHMKPMFFEPYGLIISIYSEKNEKSKLIELQRRTNDMESISREDFLKNKIEKSIENALADMYS